MYYIALAEVHSTMFLWLTVPLHLIYPWAYLAGIVVVKEPVRFSKKVTAV